MKVLVINPGGNSLKVEIVSCRKTQRYAFEGESLLSVGIEGIGKGAEISRYDGKKAMHSEAIQATDYGDAVSSIFKWCEMNAGDSGRSLKDLDCIGVRVVHGGMDFDSPALIDSRVEEKIIALEKLAPLHNKSSIEVLPPLRESSAECPSTVSSTLPFTAPFQSTRRSMQSPRSWLKNIRFGAMDFTEFHTGICWSATPSSRGKDPVNAMSFRHTLKADVPSPPSTRASRSITPWAHTLEGLMMGTRSGDVDPSLIPLLMREERMTVDEVMELLNKKSGLLAVSGDSLDTRILMERYESDPRVKLAIHMFAYRVRKAVGAYFAVLGSADGLIFGGGIAENNRLIREYVCEGLCSFGLDIDHRANRTLIDIEGKLSTKSSKLQAWVIPTQESLQIAHECCLAIAG